MNRVLLTLVVVLMLAGATLINKEFDRKTMLLQSKIDALAVQTGHDLQTLSKRLDREFETFRKAIHFVEKTVTFDEFSTSYGPAFLEVPCIETEMPMLRENFYHLPVVFELCRDELVQVIGQMGDPIDEPALYAITAAIVASRLAPYGSSQVKDIGSILSAPTLNCAQHSIYVAQAVAQRYGEEVAVERIGIDGGLVGNHAVVFVRTPHAVVIVDGTTSVVASVDIDSVLGGLLLSPYRIRDFYTLHDESVEMLRRNLRGALRAGAIRPEHLIYRDSVTPEGAGRKTSNE